MSVNGKTASLFRSGRNQALRIPREFEFPGTSARIRRLPNGNLDIEPVTEAGLLAASKDEPPLPRCRIRWIPSTSFLSRRRTYNRAIPARHQHHL